MKKKKNLLLNLFYIFFFIVIILFVAMKLSKNTTLIQLSNQNNRQMMGYIIITENKRVIMVDGGTIEETPKIINYIKQNGGIIDYWFITHAHNDHAEAFVDIVENYDIEIKNVFISLNEYSWYEKNEPYRAEFSKKLINTVERGRIKNVVKEPKLNEKIKVDNIDIEILGIKNPEITENAGNEQSMVIKFNTGKTTLLILGDTGVRSSEKLLKNQKDKLKSDIVQMAHHGQNGATKELYQAVKPRICMWPALEWLWNNDDGNGYNTGPWTTIETRKWMEELGVKENYIEKDGDIIIKIK